MVDPDDFTIPSAPRPEFEAGMAYFHIDRAQDYISQGSALTGREQPPDARRGERHPRRQLLLPAGFPQGAGSILFGLGGVDDAEDGEIIVHEYGHAIQDNQVPGFGETPQGGAMGEGFSDYLAAAMSKRFAPSATPRRLHRRVGPLGTAGFPTGVDPPCLRRTDLDLTAAQVGPGTACDAEVHCAGEAWSGALWDIRTPVGTTSWPTAR